jgi:protein SCO1/2
MHRMTALAALAATVALVGGTAAYVAWERSNDVFAACRGGVVAGDLGGDFILTDQSGTRRTAAEVFDRPTLIYFGYTFCPDICPMDNARNAAAVDILQEQGFDVQPAFVSVDPARDTVEVMAAHAEAVHPDMIGLTGTADEVRAAADAFRVTYREEPATDGFYLVSHTTFTYLVLPGTGFADFFRRDVTPEDMAARVACFLEAA